MKQFTHQEIRELLAGYFRPSKTWTDDEQMKFLDAAPQIVRQLQKEVEMWREYAIHTKEDLTGWTREEIEPGIDEQAKALTEAKRIMGEEK